jgi:hypothetical protein
MNRAFLKFGAALVATVMAVLPFAGLDNLPRSVLAQIDGERRSLAEAQRQVRASADAVARDLAAEPEFFRGIPASARWPAELSGAASALEAAWRSMEMLTTLEHKNRRQDRRQVEDLLAKVRAERKTAVSQAVQTQKEADHWIDLKRHLPDELARMEQDHRFLQSYNFSPLNAVIRKAEVDWPEKKADLDQRVASLQELVSESQRLWDSTAPARHDVQEGRLAKVDLAALLTAAETIHRTAADLPQKTAELTALAGQLYNTWDKVLVDMAVNGRGASREYRQKIRTVTTHLADASAKTGETSSQEQWVTVSQAQYEARKNDLGMAIEHKPAGKYDSEADRVAQPAGFAYIASPAQGRNQYGYWEHRDGHDFWVWYGQYALLRDLLFNYRYTPLDRGDWDGYRTYRDRGQTYYGSGSSGQRYGTSGSSTQERYAGSLFSKSGGFKDSQYASKSGGYRDSRYSSPAMRNPDIDDAPRRFGSRPPMALPSTRSYRPSPSFHPPVRSLPGRRFGRR